jgi:hypothetical protein
MFTWGTWLLLGFLGGVLVGIAVAAWERWL